VEKGKARWFAPPFSLYSERCFLAAVRRRGALFLFLFLGVQKKKVSEEGYSGYAPAIKKEARENPVLRIGGHAKKESKQRTAIQAMHLQKKRKHGKTPYSE